VLTPGQPHEATVFEALLEQGAVRRPGRGRPRRRPRRVIGDEGYSTKRIRGYLRQRGMHITLPRKHNECRSGPFNRAMYRTRNRIERMINRCKQFRRLTTRYEKRAVNYRAMWLIAVCFGNGLAQHITGQVNGAYALLDEQKTITIQGPMSAPFLEDGRSQAILGRSSPAATSRCLRPAFSIRSAATCGSTSKTDIPDIPS
jgi:transposase